MSNTISLSKGEVINLSKMPAIDLSKGGHGLSRVIVGLGWDPVGEKMSGGLFGLFKKPVSAGVDIDCDAFAIQLKNGRIQRSTDLIYYGNCGKISDSIYHTGDNLTGDGDDEQIIIDLSRVAADSIILAVCIYKGRDRKQHFGMIQNAYIRIVDDVTGAELCRYNLDSTYDNYVTVTFGELVKKNNEWQFRATGTPSDKERIGAFASDYGY